MLIGDVWEEDHSCNSIHSVNATSLQVGMGTETRYLIGLGAKL